ncbi:MAG: hypothetical protein IJE59_00725 [Clostridia bacterium]|nr:hypothetical protein [Clostridia bacterium]
MRNLTKTRMSPTQVLLLGFIAIILIGTMILKLPISNNGKNIKFIDAFFTSTSAVCVTGLTTKIPAEQFSTFGQVVIMCLIQIGGLRIYDIYITYINVYR